MPPSLNNQLEYCPACGDSSPEFVEFVGSFELVRCATCGLGYTKNPRVSLKDYDATYDGETGFLENPKPYAAPAARLSLERDALFRPAPYLTRAERWVLRKISGAVPHGTPILDLGCGTGRFLNALDRRGYRAVGIDPVEHVVLSLRSLGYEAHVGRVPGLQWDGPTPVVITLFEVLEHLPDPNPVLSELKSMFPHAAVGASVPSPVRVGLKRGRSQTDYPPNHFLRWTPAALRSAFERAGYRRVEIELPDPDATELMPGAANVIPLSVLRWLSSGGTSDRESSRIASSPSAGPGLRRRVAATAILMLHKALRQTAGAFVAPWTRVAGFRGRSSASMVVWAEP